MKKLWIYDFEVYRSFVCVTFLAYGNEERHVFIIDDFHQDGEKIKEFVKDKILVAYNNKTYDDIILNFIIERPSIGSIELFIVSNRIIHGQKDADFNLYKEFKQYLQSPLYESIDLMRLLFSKKLRVSLKELQCSLNFHNVEELPYAYDSDLTEEMKQKLILYNLNDCYSTRLVFEKSLPALKLRRWIKDTYNIDTFSLDGVNAGVAILAELYKRKVGNKDFLDKRTFRESILFRNIILPFIKFETKPFQDVLEKYKSGIWYSSHYDEGLFKKNKEFNFDTIVNGFELQYSTGGLHGFCKSGIWNSTKDRTILSVDILSDYPNQVINYKFCPEHLNIKSFIEVYESIKNERVRAKNSGDMMKSETLKLSINGK